MLFFFLQELPRISTMTLKQEAQSSYFTRVFVLSSAETAPLECRLCSFFIAAMFSMLLRVPPHPHPGLQGPHHSSLNRELPAELFAIDQGFPRRRQWHPTPVLLPGKSHGWRSLVGCSPWCCEESDTTEILHFYFSLPCIGEGNGNPLQCSCLENPRDRTA